MKEWNVKIEVYFLMQFDILKCVKRLTIHAEQNQTVFFLDN